MSGLSWNLDDDNESVTLSFPTDPPVTLNLSTEAVENILGRLGKARARMKPEVQSDLALGQKVEVVLNPRWYAEPELMMGNSLLHVRDKRFGWLHYMIPRKEARKLGEYLIKLADMPPPGPAKSKPN